MYSYSNYIDLYITDVAIMLWACVYRNKMAGESVLADHCSMHVLKLTNHCVVFKIFKPTIKCCMYAYIS